MTPALLRAATVSPPPATEIKSPLFVFWEANLAAWLVAWSKGVTSNAPNGPFHKSVLALFMHFCMLSTVDGPASNIIYFSGHLLAETTNVGVFSDNSFAITRSVGKIISHEYFSALLRILSAVGFKLSSTSDRPTLNPFEKRKVLAIAPPMIMLSTCSIRFSISAIFVEILAPPTTVTTGRLG